MRVSFIRLPQAADGRWPGRPWLAQRAGGTAQSAQEVCEGDLLGVGRWATPSILNLVAGG